MHPEPDTLFDSMLDALSNVHRRKLLMALLESNPQDDLPRVSSADEGESEAMEHLIRMHHVHLPKLVEYGFIEWDQEKEEVTKGPAFDEIKPLLNLLAEHEDELPPGWL
jgi:hypothetical protein